MQVFPFPLIANGVWYPVGILAHVFHLTIHPDIFHIELSGKKCSDEFELEFFEEEDTTRHQRTRETRALRDSSLFDDVSSKWETHPLCEVVALAWTVNLGQYSHVIWESGPSWWKRVFLSVPTSWPSHCNLNFPYRRGNRAMWLALGMWTGR